MRSRRFASIAVIVSGVTVAAILVPLVLRAQTSPAATSSATRTPWGDPDLEGIWNGKTMTPLQRPDRYAGREFLTDAEVAVLEKNALDDPGRNKRPERGSLLDVAEAYNDIWSSSFGGHVVRTHRTSLVVDPPDGKLPALTPAAQKRVDETREFNRVYGRVSEVGPGGPTDNPEDRPQDRCRGVSLPCIGALCAFSRIVQTPGWVSMYFESGHLGGTYRHIPLDGRPHLPPTIRQWMGDGVGRWDGDTLVVDTTNFTDQTSFQGSSENLHLTERFTRTAPDLIVYRVTVDDAAAFTKPWTLEMTLTLQDNQKNQIFEASCHEGNYAMSHVLGSARANERQAPPRKR